MNVKNIGLLFLTVLTLFACDDTTNTLGIGMLPPSDTLSVHTKVYNVTTESYLADAVYAKTSTGYVGRFTDPKFGYYESSFLTELNCSENFTFPEVYKYNEATKTGTGTMAGDTVTAIQLVVYYNSWFGDSLNAFRMSVYELDQKLEKNRYTNINPEDYYNRFNPEALLGRKAYTAYDTSVPDSVRNETDAYGNALYYPNVTFPLDLERGNEILQLNREHPEYFKDAESFINNVFKGVYVKSDYGDGTVLYIDRVDLQMQFRFHYVDSLGVALKKQDGTLDENGQPADSLYYSMATVFASTKEVIQANQFMNSNIMDNIVKEEKGWTYLKSPAGIFTEATIPYDKIAEEHPNDTLNAVKITFTNYAQDSKNNFDMEAPSNVLLLRKSELKTFFEENKTNDNITSFIASHNNSGTNQYTFNNIARLVTTCIGEMQNAKKEAEQAGEQWNKEKWMEENPDWNKILLIPVTITYDSSNSTNPTITGIQHDLKPGYAKLKGGKEGEPLQIEVTYTSFSEERNNK